MPRLRLARKPFRLHLLCAAALLISAPAFCGSAPAVEPPPEADFLFLGSYHMNNPGRDVHNTQADDVLVAKRQREIAEVARLIKRYRPTKIMVEADSASQQRLDEHYADSCSGERPLSRDEVEQLGFRIACDIGLAGVIAVDWSEMGPIKDEDSINYPKAIERHGQQQQRERDLRIGADMSARGQQILDEGTVRDMLLWLNSPQWLAGNARSYYRVGLYGSQSDPIGANWVMLWFGRNLNIFNNIVRHTEPGDRVLVVYGAGHGNALRRLATDSGTYRVHAVERWLRADDNDVDEGR